MNPFKWTLIACFLFVSVSLAGTCYQAPSHPEDRRADKSTLSIVTFNAEWMFLANNQDPSSCPEAGCQYDTLAEALAHVEDIAHEIQYLNADIVNLVEVEGCDVLEVLLDKIGPQYGYKAYLLQGDDTFTGQNVALLTRIDPIADLQRTDAEVRYPISGSACTGQYSSGEYGVSKNYHAQLNVSGEILNLFSLHFLAYPDDKERCFKREAQATVMRNFINEAVRSGSENIVILGDYNDFDPDMLDTAGDVPISNVLKILKSSVPSSWYGGNLVNVGSSVAKQSDRYSCWWDQNNNCNSTSNELSAIDHILMDPVLYKSLTSAAYVHNYAATCKTAISDHFPIISHHRVKK